MRFWVPYIIIYTRKNLQRGTPNFRTEATGSSTSKSIVYCDLKIIAGSRSRAIHACKIILPQKCIAQSWILLFTLNTLNNIFSNCTDHLNQDLQWHAKDFTGCFGSRQHHEHDQRVIMFSAEILIKVFSPFLRYSRLKNTLHLWRNPLGTLSHLAYLHP